jgi:hypothetical protein
MSAILDRLVHNAHRIDLRGHESLRDPKRAATTLSATAADDSRRGNPAPTGVAAAKRGAETAAEAR